MRYATAVLLLWLAATWPARAEDYRVGALVVTQPWSRPTPPVASVGAVFFSIANRGGRADRLIAISSPVSHSIEIHETRHYKGNVEMRAVASIDCPPAATVKIEPGALHVMLLGLTQSLVAGSMFPLSLRFRDAGVLEVQVFVREPE